MHSVLFAVLAVMSDSSGKPMEPAALIAELGSPRFAQREAAEIALGRLGRAALPALRSVLTSRDPEIRTRATVLMNKIEGTLLVEPTLIDFDFQDVPLADVLTAINQQSGLKLVLNPPIPAVWADRRVSVRTNSPQPFWKAIDTLCAAAQLHYLLGGPNELDGGEAGIALYDGFASSQGRFDDQGPFRIQLASMHYQSEVHLTVDRASGPDLPVSDPTLRTLAVPSTQFFLQMLVGAEPRLMIAPDGPVKVLEAIDDQGQSLVVPSRGEMIRHESGYFGVSSSPLVHVRADLNATHKPGNRLKRFRGLIPLVVSSRKSEPMIVSLIGSTNKTFEHHQTALTVGEFRPSQGDQPAALELSIKVARDASTRSLDWEEDSLGDARTMISPQRLEILDVDGRSIHWFPSSSFNDGERANVTLTFLDVRGPTQPITIRYHEIIRDRIEVPFEFRDLPMP